MNGYCISQNLYGQIAVRYGARDVIAIQDEFQESTCTNKTDAPLTGFTYDVCHVRNLETGGWSDVKGRGGPLKCPGRAAHALLQC